ncbi:MAG: tRNA (guanine(37)-N(1))-methyltransferase [Parcubacteria bacterium C7867-007]|nr:MAG: tRNA (guanine(37)-N(1))-methyltransferase [Parcubacteria bacterium C7867-007]
MLRFHLITLFPEVCDAYLNASILGRARVAKKIKVDYQSPRTYVSNKWGKVDERPYGGGPGMVMTALPVVKAVKRALSRRNGKTAIVWFVPGAKPFNNKEADALMKFDDVVLVCGRYEGIDDRAVSMLKAFLKGKTGSKFLTYSVGEATLTGGEVPAMAIVDAVTRRIPGVLGKDESVEERRVASNAVYTRPEVLDFKGKKYKVPAILLSGHRAKIDEWKVAKKGAK